MLRKQKKQSPREPQKDTSKDGNEDAENTNDGKNEYQSSGTAQYMTLSFLVGIAAAITLIMLHLFHASSSVSAPHVLESDCELFLAPSLIPNSGRGVFAGRNFDSFTTIDRANSVSVPMEQLYYHQVIMTLLVVSFYYLVDTSSLCSVFGDVL
jgi:hypothetical protein